MLCPEPTERPIYQNVCALGDAVIDSVLFLFPLSDMNDGDQFQQREHQWDGDRPACESGCQHGHTPFCGIVESAAHQ